MRVYLIAGTKAHEILSLLFPKDNNIANINWNILDADVSS